MVTLKRNSTLLWWQTIKVKLACMECVDNRVIVQTGGALHDGLGNVNCHGIK